MSKPETETLAFLESHVIFHGVPEKDLAIVFPFLDFETFAEGAAIIEESTTGNALYVITKGSVDVVKKLPEGEGDQSGATRVLATLGQGDSFGEMELLDTQHRSASVIAKEETECLVVTTGSFLRLYEVRPEAYPIIILNIARELSRRLRAADARITELEAELTSHRAGA